MNIQQACEHVIGKRLADAIIADLGLHWCIVAAVAECKVSHGPECKAALDAWLAEQRKRHLPKGGQP